MSRSWPSGQAVLFVAVTGVVMISGLAAIGSPAVDRQASTTQSLTNSTAATTGLATAQRNATLPIGPPAWPMSGGNPANTRHINTTGPTDPMTIRWKFSTEAYKITEAVIANGTIYFGTRTLSSSGVGRVYAVDVWTGKELWQKTIKSDKFVRTPAVFRDTVYVNTAGGHMQALNAATGEVYWEFPTGDRGTRPTVSNGRLFVEGNGNLYAMTALRGNEQWRTGGHKRPAVKNGSVYSIGGGGIRKLDAETGAERWRADLGNTGFRRPPVVANGQVYVPTAHGYVFAVDTQTGMVRWERQFPGQARSPTVVNDTAYINTGNGLYAIDALTGETRWHKQSPSSQPVVVNGTAYNRQGSIKPRGVATRSVYALNATTGAERARFTLNDKRAHTISQPIVLNRSLYIGYGVKKQGNQRHSDDATLYALGTPVFNYTNLTVTPRSPTINESVTATVTVRNTGTGPGTVNATLAVNGNVTNATTATLDPRTNRTVTFNLTFQQNGSYSVVIGGLTRTIAVGDVSPATTPTSKPTSTPQDDTGSPTQTAPAEETATESRSETTPTATSGTTPGFGVGVSVAAVAVVVGVVGRRWP